MIIEELFRVSVSRIGSDQTAYLGWLIGVVCWVLGFIYVSEAGIDAYASSLSRGMALMLFNLPGMMQTAFRTVTYRWVWLQTLRSLILVLFGVLFAQAFFYLPINIVHTFYSSGPFFVLALDYFLHGVTVNGRQAVGMAFSFAGVLATVLGSSLSASKDSSDF